MEVTTSMVKELREKTGAGVLDCKKALIDAGSNMDKAVDLLREKGVAIAQKKASRLAKEGLIQAYIHPPGKLGVLVEINCETDFVARNEDFQNLAKDIAMQIAATNPLCLSRDDLSPEEIEKERDIYSKQAKSQGKPDNIIERIVEGKLEKYYKEVCLLEQVFVKDPDKMVQDVITDTIARVGENIRVNRFIRYVVGQEQE